MNRHGQIAVTPETHFANMVVPRFFPIKAEVWNRHGATAGGFIAYMIQSTRLADLQVNPDAITKRMVRRAMAPASVLRSVLEEYAAVRNKAIVVEKTPGHELCLETLLEWFPNAKFVWVIRDGRDAVLSMRDMPWGANSLWELCVRWRHSMVEALSFEMKHPERVFRARYEALVDNPERELVPLHAFLGVSFDCRQLHPEQMSDVIPPYEKGWKRKANEAIDPRRAQAWRRRASAKDLLLMNCLMGGLLEKLGYSDCSVARFGPHALILRTLADVSLGLMLQRHIFPATRALYQIGRDSIGVIRRMRRASHRMLWAAPCWASATEQIPM
jgi:hypothetical protein